MGFANEEIDEFNETKYLKLKDLVVVKTEDFYSESAESFDYDSAHLLEVNKSIVSENNITKYQGLGENDAKTYNADDSSKSMKTTISKVYDGRAEKIYVKQDVTWNSVPKSRCNDLIILNYTNVLRIAESNGNPDVEMKFSYEEKKYSKEDWKSGHSNNRYKESTRYIPHKESYNGTNHDKYNHETGSYIAFKCQLPKDKSVNGSSRRYYMIHRSNYSKFKVPMETVLLANFSNLIGCEIQTRYSHQKVEKEINWGQVSFTTTPPFVSYNYRGWFWKTHNSFDSGLFNSISLDF